MAGPPPTSRNNRFAEGLRSEYQFLRLPFQRFKNSIAAKVEFSDAAIDSILFEISQIAGLAEIKKDAAVAFLQDELSKLQQVIEKLEIHNQDTKTQMDKIFARFDQLEMALKPENQLFWNGKLVNRLIVDYLIRSSCQKTATTLAQICNIEDAVDIDIFREAKDVIDFLQKQNTEVALLWCQYKNSINRQKSKTKFEFKLHRQQLIELVRHQNIEEAKKKFADLNNEWKEDCKDELEHLRMALVLNNKAGPPEIQELFQPEQWNNLIEHFKEEFYAIYGISKDPLLIIYLQAGLIALRTPLCKENKCTERDPLSDKNLFHLAQQLPFLKREQSEIFCIGSGEAISSSNPAYILPTGGICSSQALEKLLQLMPEIFPENCQKEDLPVCYFNTRR